jgi:uncharacterized protein YutE (UPF0331/DUF86 family)
MDVTTFEIMLKVLPEEAASTAGIRTAFRNLILRRYGKKLTT